MFEFQILIAFFAIFLIVFPLSLFKPKPEQEELTEEDIEKELPIETPEGFPPLVVVLG